MHGALDAIVYLYDGTLYGFYCCVYESVYQKEMPASIAVLHEAQPTLYETRYIHTDQDRAGRVRRSIEEKLSLFSLELVETVFLSCLKQKEMHILKFLLLNYREGKNFVRQSGRAEVATLLKAYRHLKNEQQALLGFVRFADYGGVLYARISPKNFILPYIAPHFAQRFHNETFMIYDDVHRAALLYNKREIKLVELQACELKPPDAREAEFQALWKTFYNAIAIEARKNPRGRMSHMPKRYWKNMPEMQDEL